jgi:hypothetical protein
VDFVNGNGGGAHPFGVPAMRNLVAPAAPHQIKVITAAKSISFRTGISCLMA